MLRCGGTPEPPPTHDNSLAAARRAVIGTGRLGASAVDAWLGGDSGGGEEEEPWSAPDPQYDTETPQPASAASELHSVRVRPAAGAASSVLAAPAAAATAAVFHTSDPAADAAFASPSGPGATSSGSKASPASPASTDSPISPAAAYSSRADLVDRSPTLEVQGSEQPEGGGAGALGLEVAPYSRLEQDIASTQQIIAALRQEQQHAQGKRNRKRRVKLGQQIATLSRRLIELKDSRPQLVPSASSSDDEADYSRWMTEQFTSRNAYF